MTLTVGIVVFNVQHLACFGPPRFIAIIIATAGDSMRMIENGYFSFISTSIITVVIIVFIIA